MELSLFFLLENVHKLTLIASFPGSIFVLKAIIYLFLPPIITCFFAIQYAPEKYIYFDK